MRESNVIKPWYSEPAIIFTFVTILASAIGFTYMVTEFNDIQDEAYAEIDQMGCGELKDFIRYEKWDDYGARWTSIEAHAKHVFSWGCEK